MIEKAAEKPAEQAAGQDQHSVGHIAEHLAQVRAQVADAARAAGRDPAEVTLIAVSKTKPAAAVLEALRAGQVVFGENRVQEAVAKMEALAPLLAAEGAPLPAPQWHLIGNLQRNKARFVPGAFAMLHTIDSARLAETLDQQMAQRAAGETLPVLLQLNWDGEPTKSGVRDWEELLALGEAMRPLTRLRMVGLMSIPDPALDEAATRVRFAQVREAAGKLRGALGLGAEFRELSMGMSHDYAWAIAEGATMVRVGTAIFGARP